MTSQVPVGTVISTAKENLIMYYVPVSSEAMTSLGLTADETGFIGIKSGYANEQRAQVETLILSGIQFLVEYASGVVFGQIDSTPTLQSLTVESSAGASAGKTAISVSGYSPSASESYKYKVADAATTVTYGQNLKNWSSWDGTSDITAATSKVITVAVVDSNYRAQAAGSATVTAHA